MEQLKNHEVMINEQEIEEMLERLAERINNDYKGEKLLVVGVLKGSFMFLSDLIRKLTMETEVHFIKASSYGSGTKTSGAVKITTDIEKDIKGENVLIVEDIIDSGFTMREVLKLLDERKPKSLKLCACLSKPSRRECEVEIDYLGFEIPDEFVIGYGLDFDEKYRNLSYIGILKQ